MTETAADGYEVRCSVVVLRQHAVLLVHRTRHDLDDWVLPGGTPCEGESLTACARRELLEETGVSATLSKVAMIVESVRPGSGRRTSFSWPPSRSWAGNVPWNRGWNRVSFLRVS